MKTKKLTTLFLTGIFTLTITFILQSCNSEKQIDPSELEGFWILKSINGKDAKSAFTGGLPTLEFDFQANTISGTGGCNSYRGEFTIKQNVLFAPNIASTRMLCFEENAEPEFMEELSKQNKLSLKDDILTFKNDGDVNLEFQRGDLPEVVVESISDERLAYSWELKKINGKDVSDIFDKETSRIPTIIFDPNQNKINGNSGCNNYNGSYTLINDDIIISGVATTRMACPNMEGENEFTNVLSDTSRIELGKDDKELHFYKNGNVVLLFEKTEDEKEN